MTSCLKVECFFIMRVRPVAPHCPMLSSAFLHLEFYALIILDFFIVTYTHLLFHIFGSFFLVIVPLPGLYFPSIFAWLILTHLLRTQFRHPFLLGWIRKSSSLWSCNDLYKSLFSMLHCITVYYIEIIYVCMEDLPYFFFMSLVPNTNLNAYICVFSEVNI